MAATRALERVKERASELRMARRYGYAGELIAEWTIMPLRTFWLCRIRRRHRVKFSSDQCIRCGMVVK